MIEDSGVSTSGAGREARRRARQAGPQDRHDRALEQTARWARAAAESGQYQDALSWLRVLERVELVISPDLAELRERCASMVAQSAAAHDSRRELAVTPGRGAVDEIAARSADSEHVIAPPDAAEAPSEPPSLDDVERLVRAYMVAFNERDVDAVCACFDPSVDFQPTTLSSSRRRYVGHEGLREWMQEVLANPVLYAGEVTRVRSLNGDGWAFLGRVMIAGQQEAAFGAAIKVRRGLITELRSYLSDEQLLLELGVLQ